MVDVTLVTLGVNVEVLVKVLVKTLVLRLAEVKAKTVSDMLDHGKAKGTGQQICCHANRDEGLDNWRHTE